MILFKKSGSLRKWLEHQYSAGKSIGFVPTMGALHAGHLSLVDVSRKAGHITVCSIFVNPTQFNDPADFERYPITLEIDIDKLEAAGCDVLFLPALEEIYPEGIEKAKSRHFELGHLEEILEGEFRPGHFQGVCLVVDRLLHLVNPHQLYLGQKDFQQCLVIKKLAAEFHPDLQVEIVPTLREPNGLAMSSRNLRLTDKERQVASVIFKSLHEIAEDWKDGASPGTLKERAKARIKDAGLRPEYVEIAFAENLEPVQQFDKANDVVILAAAWMNEVRLIDNIYLKAGNFT